MLLVKACEALHQGKRIELQYDSFSRLVEMHAVGITKDGLEMMRVWQVSGSSSGDNRSGWKILRLSRVLKADITKIESRAPRRGYQRDDKIMASICCQI